jgi:predicted nucleic acid-binding protein
MDEIFSDAFYWIALANPADQWHNAAKQFNEENPDVLLVTTEEVLTEFLNYYAGTGERRRRIVGAMCEHVLVHPKITVIAQTHDSFLKGLNLFRQREDKGYSLTDCISMSLMREREIQKVLTHDSHFTQEGFAVLL